MNLLRCAKCGAEPGQRCRTVGGGSTGREYEYYVHAVRHRPISEEFHRGRNRVEG